MNDKNKKETDQKIIDQIREKYFSKTIQSNTNYKPKLQQNLQADIAKIESIIRKLVDKQASPSELARLRTIVIQLLSVIDHDLSF